MSGTGQSSARDFDVSGLIKKANEVRAELETAILSEGSDFFDPEPVSISRKIANDMADPLPESMVEMITSHASMIADQVEPGARPSIARKIASDIGQQSDSDENKSVARRIYERGMK